MPDVWGTFQEGVPWVEVMEVAGYRPAALSEALTELERTDPEVAAARQALDDLPEQFARYNRHMAARKQVGKREANK